MIRPSKALLLVVLLVVPSSLSAQYFGQNKVHYKQFDWKVITTEHFEVYFYEGENQAALDAARMAERAYARLSAELGHQIDEPIPLILYASHSDFQQTNITPGLISEGTGGITESFKRRVTLPFTGSYGELDHVLTHELVHAFQFDVLFGDRGGLFSNPLAIRIPLWFVEGMAEYLSLGGVDPNTEMWLRDAALEGYLPTIEQLGRINDIRVYRMGQSIWDYIARTYGQRKVGELLKGAGRNSSFSKLFETVLGVSVEKLSQGWLEQIRKTYLPQIAQYKKPEEYGRRLTNHRKDLSNMNVAPAISPRGDRFVYISDKSLYNDIYLASSLDGSSLGRLVKGERTADFESLRFLNTSMAWSPDEKYIAFPAKVGAEDALYIFSVERKKPIRKLTFGLDAVYSPTWSPDGQRLAFVGITGGQSDLYVVNSDGTDLTRLTNDRYAERDPAWSPDGRKIAFSTDRGPGTDFDKLVFGNTVIATYDLDSGTINILPRQAGKNINPQWSPDGNELAFISDRTGIPNIFTYNLREDQIYQLTNVLGGVSGITPSSPAISWSSKGTRLLFCAFSGGGWDIYAINDPRKLKLPYVPPEPARAKEAMGPPVVGLEGLDTSSLPTRRVKLAQVRSYYYRPSAVGEGEGESIKLVGLREFMRPIRGESGEEPPGGTGGRETAVLPDTSGFKISNYKVRFTQDLAAGGIGFQGNVSVFGQTALAFSDILGNHSIFIAADVFGSLAESDLFFAYFNLAHRTNYGFSLFQERNDFYIFTAPDRGEYASQIYRGAELYLWRPFNRFRRLEVDIEASSVSSRVYPDGFRSPQGSVQRGKTRYFVSSSVSLVHDNALFGSTGPLAGGRSRVGIEQAVGDIRFRTGLVDYRKYFNIRQRYAIATRLVWAGSYGPNPQIFRIGGPFTLRGPDWGELDGTKVGFANFEFRFPFIEQLVLGWPLPLGLRSIRGIVFFDIGGAWDDDGKFHPFTSGTEGLRLDQTAAGYGFGMRVNLGLFILRYDLIQQTDLSRSIGKARSYITFGADF